MRYDPTRPIRVYVPTTTDTGILPGSGVVGQPQDDGQVLVYYEGNVYNAINLQTFEDRCKHAADRLRTNYPTVAKALLPADQLLDIGECDEFGVVLTARGVGLVPGWVVAA
jgi:hypothetical protein